MKFAQILNHINLDALERQITDYVVNQYCYKTFRVYYNEFGTADTYSKEFVDLEFETDNFVLHNKIVCVYKPGLNRIFFSREELRKNVDVWAIENLFRTLMVAAINVHEAKHIYYDCSKEKTNKNFEETKARDHLI